MGLLSLETGGVLTTFSGGGRSVAVQSTELSRARLTQLTDNFQR